MYFFFLEVVGVLLLLPLLVDGEGEGEGEVPPLVPPLVGEGDPLLQFNMLGAVLHNIA
jgi:hypothetical protein